MKLFILQPNHRPARQVATTLMILLLLAGCSQKKPSDVLAKVGSRDIHVADLRQEVERRRQLKQPVPDKQSLLQEMIDREVLLQRARTAAIDKDPQTAREIENLLIGKFLERDLTARLETAQAGPEEIKAEYEKNIAKFTQPAKLRLAILFLEANAKSSQAARQEARGRLLEAHRKIGDKPAIASHDPLEQGFGALAVNYSDDQASRYRGGDLGWLEGGNLSYRWPKSVLETGYALEQGRVSDVLETDGGFYLVMKTDSRESVTRPFSQLEPSLRQQVVVEKRRALDEAFRREAARLVGVTIHTQVLNSVELPPADRAVAQAREPLSPQLPGFGAGNP